MEVTSLKMARVFSGGGDVQYILPHFQREYAWEKENWQTLLKDAFSVYEIYDPENEPEHFMGALVVIRDGMRNGTIPAFKLVDGQQRLTTISLFLCALSTVCRNNNPNLYKKIRKLLVNPDEEGELHFKLLPTLKYGDRSAYTDIIEGTRTQVLSYESRIPSAFEYFCKELSAKVSLSWFDPEKLFLVLSNCMQVVFIDLNQSERPYEIFESLNAKGRPLSQPDLIRNYIAMKLPETKQEDVFETSWLNIENMLRETRTVSRIGELTAFFRHYLAFQSGSLPNKDQIYPRFRDRIENSFPNTEDFIDEIKTLERFAWYYDRLVRPENEQDRDIRSLLERMYTLEVATAYPFLLAIFEAFYQEHLHRDAFLETLQILENYIVRRYLADEPTNFFNKMFPSLWREVWRDTDQVSFPQSLQKVLLTKNYPTDNRILQTLLTRPIYDQRSNNKIYFILEEVNKYLSTGSGGHTVLDADPTVEHILPQSDDKIWRSDLGADWEEAYRDYLHTIGNLTIVTKEWNSSLSRSPFSTKRRKLSSHALRLNSEYFNPDIQHWDSVAIQNRTRWIVEKVVEIWPQFGEPPLKDLSNGQRPKLLIVGGDTYKVQSWRDVAYQMAEFIAGFVDNFDIVAEAMPRYFSRKGFNRARQMSNTWWINIDLTGEAVMNICSRLISEAELSDSDWHVEFDR